MFCSGSPSSLSACHTQISLQVPSFNPDPCLTNADHLNLRPMLCAFDSRSAQIVSNFLFCISNYVKSRFFFVGIMNHLWSTSVNRQSFDFFFLNLWSSFLIIFTDDRSMLDFLPLFNELNFYLMNVEWWDTLIIHHPHLYWANDFGWWSASFCVCRFWSLYDMSGSTKVLDPAFQGAGQKPYLLLFYWF